MPRSQTDPPPHYFISELASEMDVSPRTIRFYEERGLLSPARTPGNQRVYSHGDRARLKLILRGKRFGFSLDEAEQIRKSLVYGERKLEEIRRRKEDLRLLEEDFLAARPALDVATGYTTRRKAFGRPINEFQSVSFPRWRKRRDFSTLPGPWFTSPRWPWTARRPKRSSTA